MKKLEPVLHIQMKKRTSHFLTTLASVKPLNGLQDNIKAKLKSKTQDEFCFPPSPGERTAEKTTKGESKKETKVFKKDATRAKRILKVCIAY